MKTKQYEHPKSKKVVTRRKLVVKVDFHPSTDALDRLGKVFRLLLVEHGTREEEKGEANNG